MREARGGANDPKAEAKKDLPNCTEGGVGEEKKKGGGEKTKPGTEGIDLIQKKRKRL